MTNDDKIRDEKLQCNINREATSIEHYKYEYESLTGEEILPSDQSRIKEQATFTYSPLGKGFEKETKTTKEQGRKKFEVIEEHGKQMVKSGQFDPPSCFFSKNVSSKERVKAWFFVTFNIIIRHIFSENFIEIPHVVQKL